MSQIKILWADDEIDLLKPQLLFLEKKGYQVTPVNSGSEAIDCVNEHYYDLVFLDENMPGLTGLETLTEIKNLKSDLPIVMITKSEEEFLMDDAIGSQISDYLIKPVNPNQLLLSIKKLTDHKRLVSEKITQGYQQDFRNLSMMVNESLSHTEWVEVYKKMVFWSMELEKSQDENMKEVLHTQFSDANNNFSKFVEKNYLSWLEHPEDGPLTSANLMSKKIFPTVEKDDKPSVLLIVDNLRYDQWKVLQPKFAEYFKVKEDDCYYSILPTATSYSRNAMFAGMMPSEIQRKFPDKWLNDDEEGGKNLHESFFLNYQIKRQNKNFTYNYTKVTNVRAGKSLLDNLNNMLNNDLTIIVYNFVDLLSHVRTEMQVLKELAEDEAAYRSLTLSWFEHSPLFDVVKRLGEKDINLMLTTDHGSVRAKKPSKVIGDRNTTTNLRYKHGKNLNYQRKDVLAIKNPDDAKLPRPNVSSSFIFAKEDFYFVYPNNYNYYVNFFRDTFQHGGISLEEIIIPMIQMESK